MRGVLSVGGFAWLLVAAAGNASAAPCSSGATLAGYIALGSTGCTIGSQMFFNFRTLDTQPGATEVLPDQVIVNAINDINNPGFQFVFNLTAGLGALLQATVGFNAAGGQFAGNSVSMTGAGATADAAVSVIEDLCQGGSFTAGTFLGCPTTATQLVLFQFDPQGQLSAQQTFAAVNQIDVVTDVVVDAATAGTAALGAVTVRFDVLQPSNPEIPEPSAAALTALGVFALLAVGRVRSRQIS